ncbi:uncharacterized protein Exn isoform X2 [Euwallacea fornicatus]|uniref:uncharacterized protein Exn isoform X2 n=1 Tax=Euwallacea fornicatus TaxID=995702 RepID=UPI00338DBBE8
MFSLDFSSLGLFFASLLVSVLIYIMIRMETKISTVAWQQSLALQPSPIIFDIPYQTVDIYPVLQDIRSNQSFLHSQKLKDSIFESKKAFLEQSLSDDKSEDELMEVKPLLGSVQECKKSAPCKKISFKIKKQSSLHRRNVSAPKVTNIPSSSVAELTKKFNEMVESRSFWEEEKVKMLIQRGDSVSSETKRPSVVHKDSVKVLRKPSVKTKPNLESKNLVILKTRKTSVKKQNSEKLSTRAKFTEKPEHPPRPTTLNLHILDTSPNGTSVRAAIEKFEKRSSLSFPQKTDIQRPKPTVPEKSSALIRSLASKTATLPRSFKSISTDTSLTNLDSEHNSEIKKTELNTEFEEDIVEVINIPAVLPQRRCDSMYETLNMKKVQSSLKSVSVDNISSEIKASSALPNSSFLWRDKSPSSTSSRSSISTIFHTAANTPEEMKKLPPEIPPKLVPKLTVEVAKVQVIKRKMPLPESPILPPRGCKFHEDLIEYEEICGLESHEETFKGYDEITKPVNDLVMDGAKKEKMYEMIKISEKFKVDDTEVEHYEEITKDDDGYEPIGHLLPGNRSSSPETENIYETLPIDPIPMRRQLPPRPPPSTIESTKSDETVYNCYESIYTKKEGYYESIYGSQLTTDSGSNRDSVLSSDQKTNSLYGQPIWQYNSENTYYKPPSDVSDRVSERSDEWEDVTDNEDIENTFIVVREKHRGKKAGWSRHFREQLSKNLKERNSVPPGNEADHHYESLYTAKEDEDYDYDSFESDSESEASMERIRIVDDSGIDIANSRLPETPNNQSYRLMKFAEKNMRKFGRNLTKSFSKMKKHISKTDDSTAKISSYFHTALNQPLKKDQVKSSTGSYENVEARNPSLKQIVYSQPVIIETPSTPELQLCEDQDKSKTVLRNKGGFLTKFRRSMSLSAESASEVTSSLNRESKTKSTFYLTNTIDVDSQNDNSDKSLSPVLRKSKSPLMRPKSPPPPAPTAQSDIGKSGRINAKTSSWYADSGVFRNKEYTPAKRPNTFWYAEVGLYQAQKNSTPSTSSAENSGSNLSTPIKVEISRPVMKSSDFINHDDNESYNNMKNENPYYTESVNSFSSVETKKDESLLQDIQLRLQDEPLYQFYDAAVLESISYGDTSDFDSDNYEDVPEKNISNGEIKIRPSAMELISPKRDSISFTKTLWCEIPEVINSAVLSTLSPHQKKLQEAKFEILTSEASYLNSLNVLNDHFIKSFSASSILSNDEFNILFGHVAAVRNSSEKLLHDLEKCWQDNILLHGICDIVQKHAEENFNVYIPYCENQIHFDEVLKSLKDRLGFAAFLKHLELSETCQSLSLYSFLMLPMQRITRWPLLVDAVLKRLPQQDSEYYACQFTLATANKIVSQCNEAARQRERESEMLKLAKQLEFPDSMPKIPIISQERWLVRCGSVTHMQSRNEDTKLTFGKRFSKTTVNLFLFNDLFIVAKEKGVKNYVVQQYCPRNLLDLNTSDVMLAVPTKEAQNKNLIFLTMLENQDGKTVEYLLSCCSESDKERWIEALSPPKSEDPEETLYECWDCPQVTAIHSYPAIQPDELALGKGDVINVSRKMADGWYHGERLRDGQTGWFPANHTVEIANFHVRARNLKQRYRLLAYSENYLKSK